MSEMSPLEDGTTGTIVPENITYERTWETALYNPDMDFRKLALEARYHKLGFRLVEKEDLINVPHIILCATYREGFPRSGDKNILGDYVSLEAVVADPHTLDSNPVKHLLPAELNVFPNEPVVYNDSGTGCRRDITELFHQIGVIDVGLPSEDENPYDRRYQDWARGGDIAADGIRADLDGEAFRYIVGRGLRRSDYDSPYGPATTFYFA